MKANQPIALVEIPKPGVPFLLAGAQIAGEQPGGDVRVKGFHRGPPPETGMEHPALFRVKVDDAHGAARIRFDAFREAVLGSADHPQGAFLPVKPDRGIPRPLFTHRGQMGKQRAGEKLGEIEASLRISDDLQRDRLLTNLRVVVLFADPLDFPSSTGDKNRLVDRSIFDTIGWVPLPGPGEFATPASPKTKIRDARS